MSENSAWQMGSSGKWAPSKSTGRATPLWQPSWRGRKLSNSVQSFPSASCLWVLCGQLLPASTALTPYMRDWMALNTEPEWISCVSFKLPSSILLWHQEEKLSIQRLPGFTATGNDISVPRRYLCGTVYCSAIQGSQQRLPPRCPSADNQIMW